MKLIGEMKITVLSKEVKTSATSGKESYSLAILQNSEAGSIFCTKDVFDAVKPFHTYKVYSTYDDKYNYMKLTDVDVKTESPLSSGK